MLSILALPALVLPGLFTLVIWVVVAIILLSLLYWVIQRHAPEPIKGFAITIVVVAAVLLALYFLLEATGTRV